MTRKPVNVLIPGKPLDQPLYNEDGRLLLTKGNILTEEMTRSLRENNTDHVFLGEWDEKAFERYANAVPLTDYRNKAKEMGEQLGLRVETLLDAGDLNPESKGPAFENAIDHSLQTGRTEQQIAKCTDSHSAGVRVMSEIGQGIIKPDEVAEAAASVVDQIMDAFSTDASLLNNMTNLQHTSEYVCIHAINTSILAINIATALKQDEHQVREIGIGALLHNIGMSMVPEHIVNCDRKLDPSEHIDIQKHIGYGLYLLDQFKGLPASARVIMYQNKERVDGRGYPRRRTSNVIHRYAKIVAVADVYDAMISDRPWRKAHHPYRAMEYLLSEAHKKFDADVIKGLLQYMSLFPIGSFVSLESGDIARVVHSNFDDFYHPVVNVLFDEEKEALNPNEIVDLHNQTEVKVASVIEDEIESEENIGFV
jgi:HD-GYP domain-containing protein (c-di-GMP phosphodiesterase class II)